MALPMESDASVSSMENDEDWLVNRAKQSLKNDPFAAKSWLLTAKSLFPRSFKIQYEAYTIEKNAKNIKEVSKILEEMFRNFPNEMQLWLEVKFYSDALQSEASDDKTVFLKNVFVAFPATLQYHMLVNVAETTKDVLKQCRLMLLILERYPEQVPDKGMNLIDQLLSTEKQNLPSSPVNCYRKYLVCHVIPQVLKSCPPSQSKPLYRWLQKSIEFYLRYITQTPASSQQSDVQGGPGQRSLGHSSQMVIPGLSEKDSYIDRPWHQLFNLLENIGKILEWNMSGIFGSNSCVNQYRVLEALWEDLNRPTESSVHTKHVLYSTLVLFLYCLIKYASHTHPQQFTVSVPGLTLSVPVVIVEALQADTTRHNKHQPPSKKQKTSPEPPELTASSSLSNSSDLLDIFNTAVKCWQLLHSSDLLTKDLKKLLQHWKSDSWTWLGEFEIDVLIYEGQFKEALTKLQTLPHGPSISPVDKTRTELQMACCQYSLRNYAESCAHVMNVVSCIPIGQDTIASLPSVMGSGRHLQMLLCREAEVLPYCIQLLITCFKEKAFSSVESDDMSLGHMIVLMQYDWSKYERLFCEILRKIQLQGSFTYNLFFQYIINIDILEEFAYLKTPEGGKVNLDILSTSTKQITQTRTVTRGVNKGVKEDFRAALEKQIARSNDSVEALIRQFFVEEKELLQKHLV